MSDVTVNPTDSSAILQPVRDYLDALRSGDVQALANAFNDEARVAGMSGEGEVTSMNISEFIDFVEELRKQHGTLEETHGKPVVSLAGPTACVHVPFELRMGNDTSAGIDVFALVETDGGWKIQHKLYSM